LDEQTVTASSLNCFKRNLDRLRNSTQMGLFLDWCLKTLGADLAQPVKPRPVSDPVSYYVAGPPLLYGSCTSLLRAPVSEMTYTVSSGTLNSTLTNVCIFQ